VNPLAAVPEIPTAQPGVLHDATSEVTPIVYGMWMRMLRSLLRKTHPGQNARVWTLIGLTRFRAHLSVG
jgi:hypothetical protein